MEIKVITTMGRNVLAIFQKGKEYIALAVEGDINRNTGNAWKGVELEEIVEVMNKNKVQRVSGDGVFFRCSGCEFSPKMASVTDDLLAMAYCPKCGGRFK